MDKARVFVSRPHVGVLHMQVCAVQDATDQEILDVCNRENPGGPPWVTVLHADDPFWGKTAPVACNDDPGRMHFIVGC